MGSPTTPLNLIISDPERSSSRPLTFLRLVYRKGTKLGHMLLLNTTRKSFVWSQNMSHLSLGDLERLNSMPLRF